MSVWDIDINRHYKCSNQECQGEILFIQKPTEGFLTDCPFCNQSTLLLDHASGGITPLFGIKTAKTFGSISEQNNKRRANEEPTEPVKKKPNYWWRKNKEIDFQVLKNPKNYIATGYT